MYFIKKISVLFFVCLLASACSTPKKTVPKRSVPPISRADVLKGGTSFNNPVVILLQSEREVLDEEYKWLKNNYPGYALVRRSHTIRSARHYDIVRIKIQQELVRDIYFDCTKLWGRQ
jgi:hypothetical protein